jgi:hypothetical protein
MRGVFTLATRVSQGSVCEKMRLPRHLMRLHACCQLHTEQQKQSQQARLLTLPGCCGSLGGGDAVRH